MRLFSYYCIPTKALNMKNRITLFLLMLLSFIPFFSFSQDPTPFYAAEYYSDEIDLIDTTGLTFTVVSSMTATSDYGAVNGIYGMSLHPFTDEMYVCYQSGGAGNRRLGTMDMETGAITDIGNCGNIIDITFSTDGTLFGATGSFSPDYSFVIIDLVTASQIFIFDFTSSWYGGCLTYNPFADEIYYRNQGGTAFISPFTFIETSGTPTGAPGETQAMEILTPTFGWMAYYGTLYSFNPVTEVYTNTGMSIDNYHAFTFGAEPCTEMMLDVTSTSVCEGTEVTLDATSPSGAAITWDGGITDEVPFLPGTEGTYSYTATSADPDECELNIEVEVFRLPVVIAGSGDENYCVGESIVLSAGGDADEYTWDPLEFTPGVGTHTYYLTGSYDIGCESMDSIIITVHDLPEITATADDDLICIGDEMTFTASGAETYMWSDGIVDGEAFTPEESGDLVFSVTGTDANGCTDSATIEVEVLEQIEVTGTTSDEISGADGEIDIDIAGGFPAFEVDWDDDGTGEFDDAADRTGLVGGTYTVVVRGSEGCIDTAVFVVNSQLSITSFDSDHLNIYPNPAVEDITIEMNGTFNYQLVALNGAILLNGTGNNIEVISLKEFAVGTYFINIETDESTTTHKVVKQ